MRTDSEGVGGGDRWAGSAAVERRYGVPRWSTPKQRPVRADGRLSQWSTPEQKPPRTQVEDEEEWWMQRRRRRRRRRRRTVLGTMRKGTAATSGERGGPTRLGSNRQHRLSACSCVPAAARPVALPAASAPSRHHRCSSALTPLSSPTILALVDHPRSPPRRPRCPRCSSVPTPLSPTILALLHVISAPRRTSAAPQTHLTDIDPSSSLSPPTRIGSVSPRYEACPFLAAVSTAVRLPRTCRRTPRRFPLTLAAVLTVVSLSDVWRLEVIRSHKYR